MLQLKIETEKIDQKTIFVWSHLYSSVRDRSSEIKDNELEKIILWIESSTRSFLSNLTQNILTNLCDEVKPFTVNNI